MRRWRRWSIALALGLGLTVGRPSRAEAGDGEAIAVVSTLIACAIADATFATYDIVVAAKGELPSRGWAIAEIVATAPQTLLFNGAFYGLSAHEDDPYIVLLSVPLTGITALTTHGIWGVASTKVSPSALAGVSSAIGVNTHFLGYDITRAVNGKLGSRPMGIAQMIMTTPQTVIGAVEIANAKTNQGAWIGLTAWSGALMLHGLASAIWGARHEDPPPPPEPPPSPPPEPPGDRTKPPLMVPASIQFGPTMVTDGIARAPGVGIVGVF